ncbi:hypothetical protein [Ferrimonas lipolytica]|uniref:Haloacid dehalogenase-like hydrolase n=1 Tax=Ferrimonas lipolytica TaxID=2724191 RepID=A0A6H1UBQ6_9GAMM|nr:hypothetical protein [Ferrimonas lipolytica]QIZ76079.1 hypothetical protein HER31_03750 [Ferrimonas lipolytica]
MMSLEQQSVPTANNPDEAQLQRQQLLTLYQVSPDKVVEAVASTDKARTLLVDFDETLWLRNSTETFLANIKPAFLLAIVVQFLNLLKPWRWRSGSDSEHYREVMRLKVILFLMPWAKGQWLQAAASLGPKYVNQDLLGALRQSGNTNIHVVSFGFSFIIEPLLAAIDPNFKLTMSSTFDNAVDLRQRGKAQTVVDQLGREAVEESVCITDSLLDQDLLQMAKVGLLCQWPAAKSELAGLSPMLPFVFTKKVNRPTEKYFTRVVLGHDYLALFLALVLVSSQPLLCAISLLLFVMAFFAIYETGYYENDRLGQLLEAKPRVSKQFIKLGHHFNPRFAWLCGALIALTAAWLASYGASWLPQYFELDGGAAVAAIWLVFMVFMVGVRAVFYAFNRTPVKGRIVPMLLLQVARNCGYFIIFPVAEAGALFCLAWALGKWFPYMIYRFGGSNIGYPNHLVTGLLMLSMVVMVGASHVDGFALFFNWPAAVVVLYVLIRAGKDLWSFRSQLKPMQPIAGREL